MSRGFQTGGFQRGGFQQPETVGSGGWILQWLNLARRLAAERKKKAKDEEPQREEVVARATVELSFRAVAPAIVPLPLVKLSASRAMREMAEFREFMDVVLALEDA